MFRQLSCQVLPCSGGCGALAHPLYKDMSEYKVTLKWERGGAEFSYQKYPRDHTWSFDGDDDRDGGPLPMSIPRRHSSLHFRAVTCSTFLAIACKQKFVLDSYEDEAVGHMRKTPTVRWRSRESSYARRSGGTGIEYPVRKSSTKCTTPLTRIASLPTQSKPTSRWRNRNGGLCEAKGDAFAVRPRDMILYREEFSGAVKRSRLKGSRPFR